MRPNAAEARELLERAMSEDPSNPWAIHLYIHLMEAGAEAEAAVSPSKRLEFLVPGAPHLQVSSRPNLAGLSGASRTLSQRKGHVVEL